LSFPLEDWGHADLRSDLGIFEPIRHVALPLLYGVAMSFTDKKTSALALQEPSQDTEHLLLERLKSSSTDDEYFRWMLFVVGFYRGINKIEAATELLQVFIVAN
jgi:hypothetical protein